jgi:hypothetical protein
MTIAASRLDIKVSDEVFLATALLHREYPSRDDFTIDEIVHRVKRENIFGRLRPGVRVHATAHCVANRPPQPATLRMLYATGRSTRRLFRPGDDTHAGRTGRMASDPEDIPEKYRELVEWYRDEYCRGSRPAEDGWLSGVVRAFGIFKGVWADEHPDDYVRRLREE